MAKLLQLISCELRGTHCSGGEWTDCDVTFIVSSGWNSVRRNCTFCDNWAGKDISHCRWKRNYVCVYRKTRVILWTERTAWCCGWTASERAALTVWLIVILCRVTGENGRSWVLAAGICMYVCMYVYVYIYIYIYIFSLLLAPLQR